MYSSLAGWWFAGVHLDFAWAGFEVTWVVGDRHMVNSCRGDCREWYLHVLSQPVVEALHNGLSRRPSTQNQGVALVGFRFTIMPFKVVPVPRTVRGIIDRPVVAVDHPVGLSQVHEPELFL